MILTMLDGSIRVVRPGEALCGVGVVSVEITHADLVNAGGLEPLMEAVSKEVAHRLCPVGEQVRADHYLARHEREVRGERWVGGFTGKAPANAPGVVMVESVMPRAVVEKMGRHPVFKMSGGVARMVRG